LLIGCITEFVGCVSAARAALLTGRLPVRNGFYTTNAHARNGMCLLFMKLYCCLYYVYYTVSNDWH